MILKKKPNQDLFKAGAQVFIKMFGMPVLDGKKEDFEKSLTSYFNLSEKETETILKTQRLPIKNIDASKLENYKLYKFLLSVKHYTLFGYFTSEKVGKEVLAYDPIPGQYQACISVDDTTNGRAWSL
ncbi:gluconate 2-dehydrogenase subunit 3 family protein [Flavivirga eckloniae]|nr:gluconate 2-dehydrogenase subunit 3 family protein [Flavivirga eckloniae]